MIVVNGEVREIRKRIPLQAFEPSISEERRQYLLKDCAEQLRKKADRLVAKYGKRGAGR